jgi:hypothetical protein
MIGATVVTLTTVVTMALEILRGLEVVDGYLHKPLTRFKKTGNLRLSMNLCTKFPGTFRQGLWLRKIQNVLPPLVKHFYYLLLY